MTSRPSTSPRITLSVAALFLGAVFWGLNAVATKSLFAPGAPVRFDSLSLIAARSIWCLPVFLVLAWMVRPRTRRRPTRGDLWCFAVGGFCYGPGTTGIYAFGVAQTSAAHTVLLLSLAPTLTALFASMFAHERLSRLRVGALALGTTGAALMMLTRSSSGSTVLGDGLVSIMVTCIAVQTMATRELVRAYPPLFIAMVFGALGAGLLAIGSLALGQSGAALLPLTTDAHTVLWFDGEIVVGLSFSAQIIWAWGVRSVGATLTNVIAIYGAIAIGLASSLLVLHERIAPVGFAAAALLVVALGLALVPAASKTPRPQAALGKVS